MADQHAMAYDLATECKRLAERIAEVETEVAAAMEHADMSNLGRDEGNGFRRGLIYADFNLHEARRALVGIPAINKEKTDDE